MAYLTTTRGLGTWTLRFPWDKRSYGSMTATPLGSWSRRLPWDRMAYGRRTLGDVAPPFDPLNLPSWAVQPQPGEIMAIDKSLIAESSIAPGVSPATLLAAAQLPNAPAVVKQAAAAYTAANSGAGSSFLSGSTLGISNLWLIGGGALLFGVVALKGRRR